MTIDGIFEAARGLRQTGSGRQFSRECPCCAPNYAADTGLARCSAAALLNLFRRLGDAGQADLQAAAFKVLLAAEDRDRGTGAVRP